MINTENLSREELESAFIGMMLGDGCIYKHNKTKVEMCIKHHPMFFYYLKWKSDILRRLNPEVKRNMEIGLRYDKRTNKSYPMVNFRIGGNYFMKQHQNFYTDKKYINKDVLYKMTSPIGLFIWFVDDGYRRVYKRKEKYKSQGNWSNDGLLYHNSDIIELYTNCFSEEEHKIMRQYFIDIWNITPEIRLNHNQCILYFFKDEGKKYLDLISPYFNNKIDWKINRNLKDNLNHINWYEMVNTCKRTTTNKVEDIVQNYFSQLVFPAEKEVNINAHI